MAKNESSISSQNTCVQRSNFREAARINLHDVVPLAAPYAIGIEPSSICNIKCVYCHHSSPEGISYKEMLSWSKFIDIASQIETFAQKTKQSYKVINLIGNGDPLLNKKTPDMVRYLVKSGIGERVEITTNGIPLTERTSRALIDSGLTTLLISVQGLTAEKYKKICDYTIDYEKFLNNITFFYQNRGSCKLKIKTVDIALENAEEHQKFYETFTPIADAIGVENVFRASDGAKYNDILGDEIKTRYGNEIVYKKCCPTLFFRANILANGDVGVCGCKYPNLIIGNVFKQPFSKIWNGEKHKKIMKLHLQNQREKIPECKNCESISLNDVPEDNLDAHMENILQRVNSLKDYET